ncbi:hypothetical protein [Mucilaginibacter sp. CSA2-8R]|uniref:hypothetical protein n=1 Tax=Mucilaginibacter sp. CSA2-8R TaxID=3141542 RepID=UPI00315D11F9
MDIFQKFFGSPEPNVKVQHLSLFKEDNENGGKFSKLTFIPDLQKAAKIRPSLVVHSQKLIDFMQAKRRFASAPTQSFDKGISVTWCHIRYGNTTVRLCVPNIEGMAELIEDYEHGRIVVNQTFEELMQQAAGVVTQQN